MSIAIKHTLQQKFIFLSYINKKLNDEWIALELRQRKNSINLQTINYCKKLPTPSGNKQEYYDQLAMYVWINGMKSSNLRHALEGFPWSGVDPEKLREELNKTLENINLPEFNKEKE